VANRLNDRFNEQAARQMAGLTERMSAVTERLERIQSDVTQRVMPRPKRRPGRLLFAFLVGAGAGLAVAYLADPDRGRARRDELGRQLDAMKREANRTAQRQAVAAGSLASGLKSRVASAVDQTKPDDLTLLDRVESQVFADPAIPKGDINVMVVNGRAVLRGQVEDEKIGAIEEAVRRVVGVREVENLLHAPGTPAPN
jgi:gas vesicle protein